MPVKQKTRVNPGLAVPASKQKTLEISEAGFYRLIALPFLSKY